MDASQYSTIIKGYGLSQSAAARFFGVHAVTGRRWTQDGPPQPVAKMLLLMAAMRLTPDQVDILIKEGVTS